MHTSARLLIIEGGIRTAKSTGMLSSDELFSTFSSKKNFWTIVIAFIIHRAVIFTGYNR